MYQYVCVACVLSMNSASSLRSVYSVILCFRVLLCMPRKRHYFDTARCPPIRSLVIYLRCYIYKVHKILENMSYHFMQNLQKCKKVMKAYFHTIKITRSITTRHVVQSGAKRKSKRMSNTKGTSIVLVS